MKIQSAERGLLTVAPSVEGGVFATTFETFFLPKSYLGKLAVIHEIAPEDIVALREGSAETLAKYLEALPDQPGVFHVTTRGFIEIEGGSSAHLHDNLLREYAPFAMAVADNLSVSTP